MFDGVQAQPLNFTQDCIIEDIIRGWVFEEMCIFCGKENDRKLCNIEINGIEFVKIETCIFCEIFCLCTAEKLQSTQNCHFHILLLKLARTVILLEIRVGPY